MFIDSDLDSSSQRIATPPSTRRRLCSNAEWALSQDRRLSPRRAESPEHDFPKPQLAQDTNSDSSQLTTEIPSKRRRLVSKAEWKSSQRQPSSPSDRLSPEQGSPSPQATEDGHRTIVVAQVQSGVDSDETLPDIQDVAKISSQRQPHTP